MTMRHERCILTDCFSGLSSDQSPALITYLPDNFDRIDPERKRPCVLICPGGGYRWRVTREGEPIALRFLAAGFNAFVLEYSLTPVSYPQQLLEISAAAALIRRNAAVWNVRADQLAVCGFSAGGHLAGNLAVSWQEPFLAETLALAPEENRPDAVVMAYPVVTAHHPVHMKTFDFLFHTEAPTVQQLEQVSLETLVTDKTPPVFLYHTREDEVVPVEHSLMFAAALTEAGIPFELHAYGWGRHASGLATYETAPHGHPNEICPHLATWTELSIEWLRRVMRIDRENP